MQQEVVGTGLPCLLGRRPCLGNSGGTFIWSSGRRNRVERRFLHLMLVHSRCDFVDAGLMIFSFWIVPDE